jgi:hypothetical protein
METRLDDKVAQYLVGRSHATLDQVCRGIGIQFPSSHQHQELAIAMAIIRRTQMRVITGARIFWGVQLLPTSTPLPSYAHPLLVATFVGWIWTLLRERA